MPFSAAALAADLLDARRSGRRLSADRDAPPDMATAFAVQDEVARSFGVSPAWKVGAPRPDAPATGAAILAGCLHKSPTTFAPDAFSRFGLEVEIAVRFARDVPSADRDAVLGAIGTVHALVEIIDTRFDRWPLPNPLLGLADAQNSGALVVDPAGVPYAGQPLSEGDVTLTVDGQHIFAGPGRNTGGDAVRGLVWLAGHLAGRGGIAAGTLVTLGSLSPPTFVEPGSLVKATVAGIGRILVNPRPA